MRNDLIFHLFSKIKSTRIQTYPWSTTYEMKKKIKTLRRMNFNILKWVYKRFTVERKKKENNKIKIDMDWFW